MQKKKKQTKGRREKVRDRMRETKTRHNISRMVMAVIGLVHVRSYLVRIKPCLHCF